MTPTTEVTHTIKLTERINRIEPSATMAVVAEADKLRGDRGYPGELHQVHGCGGNGRTA
jgi:hypothetical protein